MANKSRDADSKANKVLRFPLTHEPLGFIVANVTNDVMSQAAKLLGTKGGKAKTKAKIKAARINGRKGGRPRKKAS